LGVQEREIWEKKFSWEKERRRQGNDDLAKAPGKKCDQTAKGQQRERLMVGGKGKTKKWSASYREKQVVVTVRNTLVMFVGRR